MAPHRRAAKASLKATGGTTTRNDDGDGRHDDGKGQHGDGRHDDGDGRHDDADESDGQHDDGNVQQDDMRHHDGDGRHEDAALCRRQATQRSTATGGTTTATGGTTTAKLIAHAPRVSGFASIAMGGTL